MTPVRLEPAALRSRVKHSTTEPLRSLLLKMLLTVDECGSKIAENSVFGCHLSPVGRQMAVRNSVSNDF